MREHPPCFWEQIENNPTEYTAYTYGLRDLKVFRNFIEAKTPQLIGLCWMTKGQANQKVRLGLDFVRSSLSLLW